MDSVPEEWRAIPGYSGYEASDLGRIRSVDRVVISIRKTGPKELKWKGRILKQNNSRGYRTVCVDGDRRSHGVHRLVAFTFIGPCPTDYQVDHINYNRIDNRPCNLEYVTAQENMRRASVHRVAMGIHGKSQNARLTEQQVASIRERYKKIPTRQLASEFGISARHVRSVASGHCYKYIKESQARRCV